MADSDKRRTLVRRRVMALAACHSPNFKNFERTGRSGKMRLGLGLGLKEAPFRTAHGRSDLKYDLNDGPVTGSFEALHNSSLSSCHYSTQRHWGLPA